MTHIPYPLIQINNYVAQSLSIQNGFKVQTPKTSNLPKVAIKKINWLNSTCTWYMNYVFSSSPINYIATCKTIGVRQILNKHLGNDAASLLYLSIYHSSVRN